MPNVIALPRGIDRPQGPVQIDWSNPHTRGLRHLYWIEGPRCVDLVTGDTYLATGGRLGRGGFYNGSDGEHIALGNIGAPNISVLPGAPGCLCLWVGIPDSGNTNRAGLFMTRGSRVDGLMLNGSDEVTASLRTSGWNDAGISFTANEFMVAGCHFHDADQSSPYTVQHERFLWQPSQGFTASNNADAPAGNATVFYVDGTDIGRDNVDANRTFHGHHFMAGLWEADYRSVDRQYSLATNVFQLVKPVRPRLYLVPSVVEVEATPDKGEVHAEGFAPTFERQYEIAPAPDKGEVNFEGFAPTIGRVQPIAADKGEAHFEGFAPTVAYQRTKYPDKGETNFEGFAPTVSITSAAAVEAEIQGAGSGLYNTDQIAQDDELVLEIIEEFMRRIA